MKDRAAIITTIVTGSITAVMIGIFMLSDDGAPVANNQGEVVSQEPIHWHTDVEINIKGQKQIIPANIAGGVNTHDASGQLHWEVRGPVYTDQLKLSVFFKTWGKNFDSQQLLESKNGSEGQVKMTVNGQPNTEFDNYVVKENDKIVLTFD